MPNWQADRYSSMSSICLTRERRAALGPPRRAPPSATGATRTSANSAATKNPFRSTRTEDREEQQGVASSGGPWGRRYFEASRRRSCADGRNASTRFGRHPRTTFSPPPFLGTTALARRTRPRRRVPEARPAASGRPSRRPRAVSSCGGALAHRGDRQRRVDAERGRDRRRVHAEQALVAERLAAVVDDAELRRLRHPAAAERVRRVAALGLGQLHERGRGPCARRSASSPRSPARAPRIDCSDRRVVERPDRDRARRSGGSRRRWRRRHVERAVVGVLDHREQLDPVGPVRDRLLLLEAPPRRVALGRAPVVVEEVGQRRQEDLLEREARAVEAVAAAAVPRSRRSSS